MDEKTSRSDSNSYLTFVIMLMVAIPILTLVLEREMFSTLFAVGDAAFWVLTALMLVAMVVAVEWEKGLAATGLLVGYILAIHLWGDSDILNWLQKNPWLTVGTVVLYFAAGTGWGFAKWYFWLRGELAERKNTYLTILNRFEEAKAKALDDKKLVIPDQSQFWKNETTFIDRQKAALSKVPQARENKARIIHWMTFWPLSAVWTILNDPIRRAFNTIYNHIVNELQRMSDQMFASFKQELEEK